MSSHDSDGEVFISLLVKCKARPLMVFEKRSAPQLNPKNYHE